VSAKEARAIIPKLPTIYDEPFGDSSQIPTSIICAVARREVTVALSGDAGDEMLGGYNRYAIGPQLWRRIKTSPRHCAKRLARLPRICRSGLVGARMGLGSAKPRAIQGQSLQARAELGGMQNCDDLYRALVTEWTPGAAPALRYPRRDAARRPGLRGGRRRTCATHDAFDGLTYLPDDILVKVDRAAMAVSLETRVPMLDHRVAETVWRLPPSMIIRGGRGKWALRQVLYRHVPQELVERPKAGFAIPVGQWLRGPLRDWAEELLSERRLREEGYLDAAVVRSLWAQHRSGRRDWQARLWNILMFQACLSSVVQTPLDRPR
jgi:asparagine synthase (glutamine-hydrolysing)